MTPYYERDGIVIYNGDVLQVLPSLGDGSTFDLVLTDPPYNVGIFYGESVNDRKPSYQEWCQSWFCECRRLASTVALTPGIVNVGMWYAIESPSWIICWHKPACMGRAPVGFNNWEPVLLWGKGRGKKTVDVVTAPIIPDASVEGHPCPKPLRWASGLLCVLSNGGAVLDPFMGSGTTLRAAKDAGIAAVGIEIEERYCEMAAKRLEQPSLFSALREPQMTQQSLLTEDTP